MGLQIVTPPTSDPISLVEAKAHLRVDAIDDDGLIAGYILAARQAAEDFTRRCLAPTTFDLSINCTWPTARVNGYARPRIVLPKPPLVSVSSITYTDTAGAQQTLAADQYRVDPTSYEGRIEPAYAVTWPSVRNQMATITVRFVAGYTAIPEPVRQAMLLTIGHHYENRESVVTGTIATELPQSAQALLFPYRNFY